MEWQPREKWTLILRTSALKAAYVRPRMSLLPSLHLSNAVCLFFYRTSTSLLSSQTPFSWFEILDPSVHAIARSVRQECQIYPGIFLPLWMLFLHVCLGWCWLGFGAPGVGGGRVKAGTPELVSWCVLLFFFSLFSVTDLVTCVWFLVLFCGLWNSIGLFLSFWIFFLRILNPVPSTGQASCDLIRLEAF